MAKKSASNEQKAKAAALAALSAAISDPSRKPLFGTKAKPGFFNSEAAVNKAAAKLCTENRWLEATGESQVSGKSKKELYQLTASGIQHALENAEPLQLLRDILSVLDEQAQLLANMRKSLDAKTAAINRQREAIGAVAKKLEPPDIKASLAQIASSNGDFSGGTSPTADTNWLEDAVEYVREYSRRQSLGECSLPELYHRVAEPKGVSIGEYHDGLRKLAKEGRIQLHPYTGAYHRLKEDEYALVLAQQLKYYVAV